MPGYRGHLMGGGLFAGVAWAAVALWLPEQEPGPLFGIVLTAITVLAALFPDVDTDSKGQSLFYAILAAVDLGLLIRGQFKWAAVIGFAAMLPALGHHRGWTHSWWAMFVIPLPILVLPVIFWEVHPLALAPFYAAAVLGYLSHLVLDAVL
ncbi:metal-dependent hydrolase [Desulfovibrio ferrophilus]|nr:metal-dependent hydrolase [Desulfovibrio ferrophilus]